MLAMFKSSTTGQFCAAKTMWTLFGVLCIVKFMVSGATINNILIPEFDALGASALFAVFTAGYAKRESDKLTNSLT